MSRLSPQQLKAGILAQSPTQEQQDAIFSDELEFLLRACPGSGKTWTTCRRYLWRITQSTYSAGGLAMLSFTNTAVKEFKEATIDIGRTALDEPHFVGTFDSFVERFIIGPFGHLISGTTRRPKILMVPRPGDLKADKFRVLVKTRKGKIIPIAALAIQPQLKAGKLIFVGAIGYADLELEYKPAWEAISALLRRGDYSHDQRSFWACHLLAKFPTIAQVLAQRFPEIIVDEAQDTGLWLLQLLRHLRKAGSKVTLVGDPDQCIYEFGLASVSSLAECKNEWELNERPLNKSFRCNDRIADAVKQISGNAKFLGCGPPRTEWDKAYVIGDSTQAFAAAIEAFRNKAADAALGKEDCAILCRAREQLAEIRGTIRYMGLKGKTLRMAEAAFMRDSLRDYSGALTKTMGVIREMTEAAAIWSEVDEDPDSERSKELQLRMWKYVRADGGLPSIKSGSLVWLEKLRESVGALLGEIGIDDPPNLNMQFTKRGISDTALQLPLFEEDAVFPEFRFDTIHKAKGESIGGVLVLGGKSFFDKLAKHVSEGVESEDRRLGYVAMTRAKHLLMVGVPAAHLKNYKGFWQERGFEVL